MKKISVIIPTLNRQKLLKKSIEAILANSKLPDEIIVVEQGNIVKTQEILANFNIKIIFSPVKSASEARNLGVSSSSGKYIYFIDDDLKIDKNYIQTAYKYLKNHSKVKIISGKDRLAKSSKLPLYKRLIRTFLYQDSFGNDRKVLKSGQNTVYLDYTKPVNSQWASGTMIVKKEVFNDFMFREDFIRWSFGEDVDFSYRVYKMYGSGSIKFLPKLIFNHEKSGESRIGDKKAIRMMFIYRYIFWKQEVYTGSILNGFLYIYSEIFRAILHSKMYKNRWDIYKEIIKTQRYILKNYPKIDSGEVDFNGFILS